MNPADEEAGVREETEARRNAFVFTAAAALSGSAPSIAISLGGLAGGYLLGPDKSLATLPVSFFVMGGALGAMPAARLMARIGRRAGFIWGASVGIVGSLVAAFAVLAGSFLMFTVGLAIAGIAGAFTQQYRFAAADSGSPAFRAKAISWVMLGGIAAAVLGPQSMILTRHWFDPIPFVGSYLAMAVLFLGGMLVLFRLNGVARAVPPKVTTTATGRPLAEIVRQPRFIVALICGIGSYALMSLVMTAAPLAMVACGFGQDSVALGIQWHILAMYGPSFFTGALIARFGQETIVAVGLALLAAGAALALAGIAILNFWGALVLLGLGWNFGFISATTMLTQTYRPEERSKVQGLNDSILFGFVALASFSSGKLFSSVGWSAINVVVLPMVAICAVALAFSALGRRRLKAV
jgi:MFS family permease